MRMLSQEEEKEDNVEVTWEDQQMINKFSKLNTRYRALMQQLEEAKQEKEALDDLSTELELADEDEPVLYKIGDSFVQLPHSRAMKRLENESEAINKEVDKYLEAADDCDKIMKELKVTLYAKFGSAINLDE